MWIPALGDAARTQAKRLGDVATEARDYVAVTLDLSPAAIDIDVTFTLDNLAPGRDINARIQRIRDTREQIAALQTMLLTESAELAVEFDRAGIPSRDIATLVGLACHAGSAVGRSERGDSRQDT
ncbi:hypothetical protein [Nocardia cyriacigeorgica]|uniref:hypothetical protein n=1 Tax=Nocardia cyriacigeorgica TaxID=135487 RepID=UPI001032C16F|nr:hypothetical protein [Nocardia cyriacigeorgica]